MDKTSKLFDVWAKTGRSEDMEKGHGTTVNQFLGNLSIKQNFRFLDIGCGNGWVVRKISKLQKCILAEGVDGAPEMINKARKHDTDNNYYIEDIESWVPNKKYDIIFSMEVFYYFKEPQKIINNLIEYLNEDGILIIGIDHYAENIPSLNWDKEYNISTNTLSIQDWKRLLINAKLVDITKVQYGASKDWQGTLILLGNKKT